MNPTSRTFRVGDRVRIGPESSFNGKTGQVVYAERTFCNVAIVGLTVMAFGHDELVAATEDGDLIAAAEAAGAYEFNRWIADGMLCRRYISPDGNIDLTVRVP